ncbi:MAG: serine hydrolase [Anaerolineae bacterium]
MLRSRTFWLALLAVLALAIGPRLWIYQRDMGPFPPGVEVAGLDLSGAATMEDAALMLYEAMMQPVLVSYRDQRLILRPEEVGFQPDIQATLQAAAQQSRGDAFWRGFFATLLGRPAPPTDVPLQFTIDAAELARWLDEIARRYDRDPMPPRVVPATGQIAEGRAGWHLRAQESVPGVVAALTRADAREVTLVVEEIPPPRPDISLLRDLLQQRIESFPGIASVWVRDIRGRREAAINEQVAYAAMSTMKIAILEEVYRHLDEPPDVETTRLISETMLLGGNYTANLLLGIIGDGSPDRGAEIVTSSMRRLGLVNTFIAAPYDKHAGTPPRVVTPANQDKTLDTKPDPFMQTTAKDMGLLMEMIVLCSEGGGTLLAAYPGQLTPEECQQMLEWMSRLDIDVLLEAGLPEGTRIAHKHGFIADTHADVGAIWGPNGPYVIAVYLYRPTWLEWELSSTLVADLSRITYEFLRDYPP